MKIKTSLFALILVFVMSAMAAGVFAQEKHIIFFAQNSDIPFASLKAIHQSKNFSIVVPINSTRELPRSMQELISIGKVEPAMSFNPEPVMSIFDAVYPNDLFNEYLEDNIVNFINSSHKKSFGLFLQAPELTPSLLKKLHSINLAWTVISNSNLKSTAVNAYGVNMFLLYRDFPTNASQISNWISSKKYDVLPVLLTSRHLKDAQFMSALIRYIDSNNNAQAAVPLYIITQENLLIQDADALNFSTTKVDTRLASRIKDASAALEKYRHSENYNQLRFSGALDEFIYLCSRDFLSNSDTEIGMANFDTAYANIFRLLGGKARETMKPTQNINAPPAMMEEDAERAAVIENGINVASSGGQISGVAVINSADSIDVNISFSKGSWPADISQVDVYIDMNHIENVGNTGMLSGNGQISPSSSWEYALSVKRNTATLYRGENTGRRQVATFSVSGGRVSIPKSYLRGNPRNWGVQAVAVRDRKIVDFLYSNTQEKKKILESVSITLPAVRAGR